MQGCSDNGQLIGRAKTLELAYGCADQFPAEIGEYTLSAIALAPALIRMVP